MASRKYKGEEVDRLVREYKNGTLTRTEFCRRHGIPVTTLDYWRLRRKPKPRLVEVEVETATSDGGMFCLVLGNGRRIECGEACLAQLIRAAESA